MSKRKAEEALVDSSSDDLYRSEPIEDRTSTFIGYFSPTLAPKELQRHVEFKSASHKMLAWRRESKQRTLPGSKPQLDIGNDDDGEKYGGKKIEGVLESMKVMGSCVVARWYGGVMLGPVRFTHMENCARGAVKAWQEAQAEESTKKRKLAEDEEDRKALAKSLGDRDGSIVVLRTLASEKEGKVKAAILAGVEALAATDGEEAAMPAETVSVPSSSAPLTPQKPALDYSAMPLERLRALDKARDATLSFLLKRISKAEADLAAIDTG